MAARLKIIDRDTPMLLPVDLREWVPANHIVHFILDAVKGLPLEVFHLNHKGSGSKQYSPEMMLSLLIYCYVTRRFSSRVIEEATFSDVVVRYICANTHPDHDTICTFRKNNEQAFKKAFVDVLELASSLGKLKQVGTVSLDGTKIKANASKHAAVSYAKAGEQLELLKKEVEELNAMAKAADALEQDTGLDLPQEIIRREDRIKSLDQARKIIKERHLEKQALTGADKESEEAPRKKSPKEPEEVPPKSQYNFTDPESRIMKAGNGKHFEQAYNAQAVVDTESMLILGKHVTNAPNDKQQLIPTVGSIPNEINYTVENVLADSGYYSEEAVSTVEANNGPTVYASVGRQSHHKSVQDLKDDLNCSETEEEGRTFKEKMSARLKTRKGRDLYKLRKQTVEPVFGIIKEAMGFRRFLTRGLASVSTEWNLITLAYNCKRLFNMLQA
jgi:transposase